MASQVQSLKDNRSITVAGAPVKLSQNITSLGVTIDDNLTFNELVRNVCKVYCTLEQPCQRTPLAVLHASVIVGSRLDYCNALFVGMSEVNLDKLQRVQNLWLELSQELVVTTTSHQSSQIYTGYQSMQG